MCPCNISGYVKEMYGMGILSTEISHITDKIIPFKNECCNWTLEAVYTFVFLEMHYGVLDNGSVESRAINNILSMTRDLSPMDRFAEH